MTKKLLSAMMVVFLSVATVTASFAADRHHHGHPHRGHHPRGHHHR